MSEQPSLGVLTLPDSDGVDTDFDVLTVLPVEGTQYAVLAPVEQLDSEEDGATLDLYIFQWEEDDENVTLHAVEDDEVLDRVMAVAEEELFGVAPEVD